MPFDVTAHSLGGGYEPDAGTLVVATRPRLTSGGERGDEARHHAT
jgi:hypothetical protein